MPKKTKTKNLIIGLAGGTGSGKTTLADALRQIIGKRNVLLISEDSYYKDWRFLREVRRRDQNYDCPEALDYQLLAEHLCALKSGRSIREPVYDFIDHARRPETRFRAARPVIIVEGILLFAIPETSRKCDLKIFIKTADDIRFLRRLKRDIDERQRSVESVIDQYVKTVRPMHRIYVEPSESRADLVVDGETPVPELAEFVKRYLVSKKRRHFARLVGR